MVMPMFEPICAGIMVSLINKYVVNNLEYVWKFCGCQETGVSQGESIEDGDEESMEREAVSSESTTITSDVQVHCHHY